MTNPVGGSKSSAFWTEFLFDGVVWEVSLDVDCHGVVLELDWDWDFDIYISMYVGIGIVIIEVVVVVVRAGAA